MTSSERVYRMMLLAYPLEHRRRYGEPMVQLFRDRMRRDGGGFAMALVWVQVGFDLARSAFTERIELARSMQTWTSRWWEAMVGILAIHSAVLSVTLASNGYPRWGIAVGLVPAALLSAGLVLRKIWPGGATVLVIAGSVFAAAAWWLLVTVVLAVVVIVGRLSTKKIGPAPSLGVTAAAER